MRRYALTPSRRYLLLLAILLLLGPGSCGWQVGAKVLKSKKERNASPHVQQSDLRALVAGNTTFAFELYHALRKENGNLFCSPWSISTALAMTYVGARGKTERQMAQTLHFNLPQKRLHSAFNASGLALAGRGKRAGRREEEGFRLHMVDAIWGQTGHPFIPQFLDLLVENYGAGLRLLDFASVPEAARATINRWVSRETDGKIKDLLPERSIDGLTVLVLTDAIYFKAKWMHPFKRETTRPGVFHLLGGREVTIDMMSQTGDLGYAEGEEYQAVELPYRGGHMSMIIFLPREGRFGEFEGSLRSEQVKRIVDRLAARSVRLTMPRFRYESRFALKKVLAAMGMRDAFGLGAADFSGMDGMRDLFISDVHHKAFVAVDEAGTEAAAATAVVMKKGRRTSPIELKVDRPFIFMIRDIETGTVLFTGRVLNPSA